MDARRDRPRNAGRRRTGARSREGARSRRRACDAWASPSAGPGGGAARAARSTPFVRERAVEGQVTFRARDELVRAGVRARRPCAGGSLGESVRVFQKRGAENLVAAASFLQCGTAFAVREKCTFHTFKTDDAHNLSEDSHLCVSSLGVSAVARDCLGAVTALTFDGARAILAFVIRRRRRRSHASSPGSLTVLLFPRLARDGEDSAQEAPHARRGLRPARGQRVLDASFVRDASREVRGSRQGTHGGRPARDGAAHGAEPEGEQDEQAQGLRPGLRPARGVSLRHPERHGPKQVRQDLSHPARAHAHVPRAHVHARARGGGGAEEPQGARERVLNPRSSS